MNEQDKQLSNPNPSVTAPPVVTNSVLSSHMARVGLWAKNFKRNEHSNKKLKVDDIKPMDQELPLYGPIQEEESDDEDL